MGSSGQMTEKSALRLFREAKTDILRIAPVSGQLVLDDRERVRAGHRIILAERPMHGSSEIGEKLLRLRGGDWRGQRHLKTDDAVVKLGEEILVVLQQLENAVNAVTFQDG